MSLLNGLSFKVLPSGFLLLPENYLPAVTLGGGRGGGALVNRSAGLVHWRGAPLLRAHGAAVGAPLVVMMLRHVGHQLAVWTSLSTGPLRSGASSDTSSGSLLAVHLKQEDQEVILLHSLSSGPLHGSQNDPPSISAFLI